jgi:hypothetical protein
MSFLKNLRDAINAATGAPSPASGETYEIRGFAVYVDNTRPDIQTTAVLERLDDALALIDRTQPWRLAHMRRDLSRFLVVRYPCRGAFFPHTRECMTELTFLARRDISAAPVAASILHEGVHARVHGMGVRAESKDPAREERLCRRAELDFGLALPPALGGPVVERARLSLELADEDVAPSVDWNVAMKRQAEVDRNAARGD